MEIVMVRKINIFLGGMAACVLSVSVMAGCSNSNMSSDDVKNFKPTNVDTAKRSKDIAAAIDNYYKMHPEQKRPDNNSVSGGPTVK